MNYEELHQQELAKVAPEGHRPPRGANPAIGAVFCPWAYADVRLELNHRNWYICSGCQRPVDVDKLKDFLGPDDWEVRQAERKAGWDPNP